MEGQIGVVKAEAWFKGLVEDVMMGLCVTVKTKVCNYGMVELMFCSFCWLGTTGPFGLCKSIFGKYFIFRKGKCIRVFGCLRIRFMENQFRRLVRTNIYGKWLPFYGKSIPMFGSVKHFTENEIHFLRKINSHVWFVDHFTENNNFKHLHCLNKPVTVQKYSSTST